MKYSGARLFGGRYTSEVVIRVVRSSLDQPEISTGLAFDIDTEMFPGWTVNKQVGNRGVSEREGYQIASSCQLGRGVELTGPLGDVTLSHPDPSLPVDF
jgi:hypothetical protein